MIEVNRRELRDDMALCQGVIGRIHGKDFAWTDEGHGQDELGFVSWEWLPSPSEPSQVAQVCWKAELSEVLAELCLRRRFY